LTPRSIARRKTAFAHPVIADAAVIPTADEEPARCRRRRRPEGRCLPEEIMAFAADQVAAHEKVHASAEAEEQRLCPASEGHTAP
jgi:hypothetical protein